MATLAAVQSSCAFASPDPLDQAIQRELAALATIEADHRSACRWLDEWSGSESVEKHLARHIENRHRREREPHLLRLVELHQQRMALSISATLADMVASASAPVCVEQARAWDCEMSPNQKPSGSTSLGIG